jgi:biotin carboxylase
VSLSASRGVIRADDPAFARDAARRIIAILDESEAACDERILVESYVPGDEVAVEGLLRRGQLEILAIFDKPDPLEGPYFEETIYVTPSRHPEPTQKEIVEAAKEAAEAIGLTDGPIHAEMRLNGSGAWMLEMAARAIGGLCSRTIRFGLGASLEELILRHALGLPITNLGLTWAASGVMMLPIPRAGCLEKVTGRENALAVPGIAGVELTIPTGRAVRPLPEGDRYLGFIFARADSPAEVEAALRSAHSMLEISIN